MAKYITLLKHEIEALGNTFPNRWPAEAIFSRKPFKWQFRFPVQGVEVKWDYRWLVAETAAFASAAGEVQKVAVPAQVGDMLYIDEECRVEWVGKSTVHFVRTADGNQRTIRSQKLADHLRPHVGRMAPRPIPELMASLERVRVRALQVQRISEMQVPDYAAEGAASSNYAGQGRYLPNATTASGFTWGIWAEKYPDLIGRDAWVWVLTGERVAL